MSKTTLPKGGVARWFLGAAAIVTLVGLVAAGCGRDDSTEVTARHPRRTAPASDATRATARQSDAAAQTSAVPPHGTVEGDATSTPAGLHRYQAPEGYPAFSMLIPSSWSIVEAASDEGQLIEFTTAGGRSTLALSMLHLGMPESELGVWARQIADSWGQARQRERLHPWSVAEWEIIDGDRERAVTGAVIAARYGDLPYTVLLVSEPVTEFFTDVERALASWVWHQEPPIAAAHTVRAVVGELPLGVPAIVLTATVDGIATIEYDETTTFVLDDGTPASPGDLHEGVTVEATGSAAAEATLVSSRVVIVRP